MMRLPVVPVPSWKSLEYMSRQKGVFSRERQSSVLEHSTESAERGAMARATLASRASGVVRRFLTA